MRARQPAGGVPFGAQLAIGLASFYIVGTVAAVLIPAPPHRFAVLSAMMNGFYCALAYGVISTLVVALFLRWPGFAVGILLALGLLIAGVGLCAVAG